MKALAIFRSAYNHAEFSVLTARCMGVNEEIQQGYGQRQILTK